MANVFLALQRRCIDKQNSTMLDGASVQCASVMEVPRDFYIVMDGVCHICMSGSYNGAGV